jgi:hypothetical protein
MFGGSIRLMAMQTINHYITYSVITSSPELTYSSVLSTVRLFPVTSGDFEGSTFVEWTGNFSSDADAGKSHLGLCAGITESRGHEIA